ncbi:MAG: sigma-54-dependent Fis family transcriptional regulator, partial [Duncaniella sp.]|nr:sigma-54-dependent Fis family transcriptional regulator [Duncaniella sp.]
PYPGNIRELKNLVERTLLVSDTSVLTRREFQAQVDGSTITATVKSAPGQLERNERELIEQAITKSGGNLSRAAGLLGISRQALYRRIDKYGIKP